MTLPTQLTPLTSLPALSTLLTPLRKKMIPALGPLRVLWTVEVTTSQYWGKVGIGARIYGAAV